ncbi:MAG: hypothetical protein Q7S26_00765 [bacterium]|nr:hypothetical protein [bacterium]
MEENLEAQIEKRLAELPEDIRAAVLAADLNKHVQEIGTKYQLHIDQQGTLGDEILLAMLGFTELDKLQEHIQTQVGVSGDVANKIVQEVSEQIFLPIRESLVKFGKEQAVGAAKSADRVQGDASRLPEASPLVSADLALPKQNIPVPVSLAAEKMLTEKTVTVPAPTPAAGAPKEAPRAPYKVDPYREPVE